MKRPDRKKGANIVWNIFSSVRLTISLLIILALVSIIGTLIPQGQGAVEFARNLSPGTLRFFSSLNLFDIYHSVWFRILIATLALNLMVCSIDRFSGTWKRFTARPRPDRSNPFEDLPPDLTFLAESSLNEAGDRVGWFLDSRFKKTRRAVSKDRVSFYGDKGRFSHFGVYLVHLSVLFMLAGSLVGSFLGFEAFVNIAEGERIGKVELKKGGIPMDLGFEVLCDRFFVEFYDNGAPREYRSDLRFFFDGKEVEKASTRVNHPVQFRGVTFYQSSYGTIPGKTVLLNIARKAGERKETSVTAEMGKKIALPGEGEEGHFQVLDIKEDLKGMLGPAALISVLPENGKEVRFWLFLDQEKLKDRFPPQMLKSPMLNPSAFAPYTFFLKELKMRYYTGLQVNRDPGVSVVWIGCFLMIIGFIVAFFTSHRRVWIRVLKTKNGVRISVAGTANKNPVGLQREVEHLTRDLKELFGKKD